MMKLFLLPLLVLLLSVHICVHVSSSQCNFPAIFNFGDSNSDTGGLSAPFRPLPPPYGETYFEQPVGRCSDGRLIIDFLAESLGLPYLSPYLDSLGTNFTHGANFATVGSTIIDQKQSTCVGGYSPFSLGVQESQFSQFNSRSQLVYQRGGVFMDLMPKEDYFSRALYTVDIGQNDLTLGSSTSKSAEVFIPDALRLFAKVIKGLYDNGGRYFWIHNTGPLGCLSYMLVKERWTPVELDSIGCVIAYNELAQQFNTMLNETVVKLRRDLPLATFTYVDVYSVKYLLFSEAEKYGFEHPLRACCGYGDGAYNYDSDLECGATIQINDTEIVVAKSCINPSKRISWDGVHYSEAANRWIFSRIATGKFSDPSTSLSSACHGDRSLKVSSDMHASEVE